MADFIFDHLDRQTSWKDIFNTIDENFDKVTEYLSSMGNDIKVEKFTVKSGEQYYFYLSSEYNTLTNSLAVYVNGRRLWSGSGFYETGPSSFKLEVPATSTDEVVAVYNNEHVITNSTTIEKALRSLIHREEHDFKITSSINGVGNYLVDLGGRIELSSGLKFMSGYLYSDSNNLFGSVYENTGRLFAMVTQTGANIKIGNTINVSAVIYSLDDGIISYDREQVI